MNAARLIASALLLFLARNTPGQTTNAASVPALESSTNAWTFSAFAYIYFVPNDRDYVNPILTADHNWLHLEARYNYEARETGSLWAGYNFSFGRRLVLGVTPMLGGVFGDLTGVAPGCELSLTWRQLALSVENEYVFDTGDGLLSFYYNWSELSYSPADWFRAGLAIQRTRLYHSEQDIQRGFLVGFNYRKSTFTTYVFNLGWTAPTFVFAVGVQF